MALVRTVIVTGHMVSDLSQFVTGHSVPSVPIRTVPSLANTNPPTPLGGDPSAGALSDDEQTRVRKLTKRTKPRTRLPEDWAPPTDEHAHSWHQEARRQTLTRVEVSEALREFKLHWAANGEPKADWVAAWRLWLSRVRSYARKGSFREAPSGGMDWDAKERVEREERANRRALEAETEKRRGPQTPAESSLLSMVGRIGSGPSSQPTDESSEEKQKRAKEFIAAQAALEAGGTR